MLKMVKLPIKTGSSFFLQMLLRLYSFFEQSFTLRYAHTNSCA